MIIDFLLDLHSQSILHSRSSDWLLHSTPPPETSNNLQSKLITVCKSATTTIAFKDRTLIKTISDSHIRFAAEVKPCVHKAQNFVLALQIPY
jgi:hypothetical protein